MKKCPQCQSTYADENIYCFNDGSVLVDDQPPTVAFNYSNNPLLTPSFVVDLSPQNETPTQFAPFPPKFQNTPTKSESKNYVAPLLIGLLIGGGLVLAMIFLLNGRGERKTEVSMVNANTAKSDINSNTNSVKENFNVNDSTSSTVSSETNKSDSAKVKSTEDEPKKKGNYNGRVIMINAYVRSAPSDYTDEIDMLPMNSNLKIGKRAAPNSPWFRVTSESGASGWMHGNTIEFTR